MRAGRLRGGLIPSPSRWAAWAISKQVVRRYAAIRHDPEARSGEVSILVFVADHGVADEGVSAYPKEVTAQMLRNIARGGAAISVLARHYGYQLKVMDIGVATDTRGEGLPGVIYRRIGRRHAQFHARAGDERGAGGSRPGGGDRDRQRSYRGWQHADWNRRNGNREQHCRRPPC